MLVLGRSLHHVTTFARKIIVLGTNQTKMAAGRSVGNHGDKGQSFRLGLLRADYCDNSAQR